MTLERARELLKVQAGFGGGYNANSSNTIQPSAFSDQPGTCSFEAGC